VVSIPITYNDFMCYTNKYLKQIGMGSSEYNKIYFEISYKMVSSLRIICIKCILYYVCNIQQYLLTYNNNIMAPKLIMDNWI